MVRDDVGTHDQSHIGLMCSIRYSDLLDPDKSICKNSCQQDYNLQELVLQQQLVYISFDASIC